MLTLCWVNHLHLHRGAAGTGPPSAFRVRPLRFGLQVSPLHAANEVWQSGSSYGKKCAADVKSGVNIGPKRPFAAAPLVMAGLSGTSEGHPFCPWAFPHHPYLGVKFVDKVGRLHYGWVRVSVQTDYSTVIEEYAYGPSRTNRSLRVLPRAAIATPARSTNPPVSFQELPSPPAWAALPRERPAWQPGVVTMRSGNALAPFVALLGLKLHPGWRS